MAVAAAACAPVGPAAPVAAAAAPAPAAVAAAPPVVVLDPGHNGGNAAHPREIGRPVPDGRGGTKPCNTTGTATRAGYAEHAFAFDVATRVSTQLEAQGVRVVLTRPDDRGTGPCVDVRGRAGQEHDAAAVVSIHADGGPAAGRGFHVIAADPPLDPVQAGPARVLADAVRRAMLDAGFPAATYTGRDGLSLRPDLAGLNHARRPAVIVECANMRNSGDAALVSSPEGRARYADAITRGVLAFLGR